MAVPKDPDACETREAPVRQKDCSKCYVFIVKGKLSFFFLRKVNKLLSNLLFPWGGEPSLYKFRRLPARLNRIILNFICICNYTYATLKRSLAALPRVSFISELITSKSLNLTFKSVMKLKFSICGFLYMKSGLLKVPFISLVMQIG